MKVGFKGVYTLHDFRDGIHYTVFVMVYKTGYSRQHSTIHVQFSAEPPRGGCSMPRWFAVLIRGGSNEYPQSVLEQKVYPYIWNISYALVRYSEILSVVTCLMRKSSQ